MNAQKELISELAEMSIRSDLRIAKISCTTQGKPVKIFTDLFKLLEYLDFEYDDGFGNQELFGIILFKDNTWMERAEYDGSEWWEYKKCPTVDEILKYEVITF